MGTPLGRDIGISRITRDAKGSLSAIGVGMLVGYLLASAFSNVSLGEYSIATDVLKVPMALSCSIGGICGCLATMVALRLVDMRGETMPRAVAVHAWLLGSATVFKAGLFGGPAMLRILLGDVVSWACVPFLIVACHRAFRTVDEKRLCQKMAWSLLVGIVLFVGVASLGGSAGLFVMAFVLPAGCFLIWPSVLPSTDDRRESSPQRLGDFPIAPSLAVMLLGIPTVSDVLVSLVPVGLNGEMVVGALNIPAVYSVSCLSLLAFALLLAGHRGAPVTSLLYPVGTVLVAVGYLALPFSTQGGFSLAVSAAGEVVMLVFLALLVRRHVANLPTGVCADRAFVRCLFMIYVGMFVADMLVVVMQLLPGYAYGDFVFRTAVAVVAVVAILVLALVTLPGVERAKGESASPSEDMDSDVRARADAEEDGLLPAGFAERYALSPREEQIAALLAGGRDVPAIERKLGLAKSTVKTHVKHIYEKCAVTSRQKLLDLVEDFYKSDR